MSHFSVAVLHRADQTVEELLAPYDEELESEIELEYTREEAIKAAREEYRKPRQDRRRVHKVFRGDVLLCSRQRRERVREI